MVNKSLKLSKTRGSLESPSSDLRRITSSGSTSTRDVSLEVTLKTALNLEGNLEKGSESSDPRVKLHRYLSLSSANGTVLEFRDIGTGLFGKVFEHPGTLFVYKLNHDDQERALWNNYIMHMKAKASFSAVPQTDGYEVQVPHCYWYANKQSNIF
ncbi:hypothetical protein F5Y19DRAFT_475725 [Xylariaceae sp. FL1651]|nr:hypothetical protein F5Y19DRAFT_475725 [Xylariaceae sp. FL1651]